MHSWFQISELATNEFVWLLYWQDELANGVRIRKRKRKKLASAKMAEREVKKIAAEFLRPLN